jgi:hypothetical protein
MDVLVKLLKEENDAAQQAKIVRADAAISQAKLEIPRYTERDAKEDLIRLEARNKIKLMKSESQFAEKYQIRLVDIDGINYGFVKILVD